MDGRGTVRKIDRKIKIGRKMEKDTEGGGREAGQGERGSERSDIKKKRRRGGEKERWVREAKDR